MTEVIVTTRTELQKIIEKAVSEAVGTTETKSNELMNAKETAQYLKVSESCLAKWKTKKKIPFSRVHGKVYFRREKLDKWIEKNEVS